jgi:hypothetical protein
VRLIIGMTIKTEHQERYESYYTISKRITEQIEIIQNADSAYKMGDMVMKTHGDLEYLAVQMRYETRFLPHERAFEDSKLVTANVACDLGYGIETTSEGWLRIVLPPLLAKRKNKKRSTLEQFRGMVHIMLDSFKKQQFEQYGLHGYLSDRVVIFKHITDPSENAKDYDNQEIKVVLDEICTFYLVDDSMKYIDLFQCSQSGETSFLVVYLIPQDHFVSWIKTYRDMPEKLLK